jgi:F-type H+-transporting ATPase subunit b
MNVLPVLMLLQEHAEGETPNVFALSQNVSFWTLVIFLLLLGVLAKWAFPPILGYAAAREKRIQDSLDEAKKTRDEAAALLAQQRQELTGARQESQQIIAEAKQAAEKVRAGLIEQARADQEAMLTRAKQEIERERERAVESVRHEAVDLAIAAAARLMEKKLGGEDDRRLVSDFLDRARAGSSAPGAN